MLVHRKVTSRISFASIHLYTCMEWDTVCVQHLAHEHNTMSLAGALTRTTQSWDMRTNHEATTPPCTYTPQQTTDRDTNIQNAFSLYHKASVHHTAQSDILIMDPESLFYCSCIEAIRQCIYQTTFQRQTILWREIATCRHVEHGHTCWYFLSSALTGTGIV